MHIHTYSVQWTVMAMEKQLGEKVPCFCAVQGFQTTSCERCVGAVQQACPAMSMSCRVADAGVALGMWRDKQAST